MGQGFVGMNMFAYCLNNPIMRYDPSGCSDAWADMVEDYGGEENLAIMIQLARYFANGDESGFSELYNMPVESAQREVRKINYNRAIDKFDVENNYLPQIKEKITYTYCNYFAKAVSDEMFGANKGLQGGNANTLYNWLPNEGWRGWKEVSISDAQQSANNGFFTIAIYYEQPNGHVQVIRPQRPTDTGFVCAQAGLSNYNYGPVMTTATKPGVKYYTLKK